MPVQPVVPSMRKTLLASGQAQKAVRVETNLYLRYVEAETARRDGTTHLVTCPLEFMHGTVIDSLAGTSTREC